MKYIENQECKLKVKLGNGTEVTHSLKFLENGNNDGFYDIRCYDDKNNEMGLITFKFENSKFWLYKIETHEAFGHKGVGTALIQTMEYVAMKNHISTIEGKYYPENEFAKPFYLKNNYNLPNQNLNGWDGYDDTWTMSKSLDFEYIKNNISPNISFEKSENEREM